MSDSSILETSDDGSLRVRLELDPYPDEPYDDGASPLLRLDRTSYGVRAEHVMAGGRPLDQDGQIEGAAQYWQVTPSDDRWWLFEKYLRAFHGATQVESWHSGSYWYVTYDSAAWREYAGTQPGSASMDEYRAWCEGDVWGYVVEERVTWHTDDPGYDDEDQWEDTEDSCFGFYGRDYAEERAREALADAVAVPAPLDITPDQLQAAVEDMQRVAKLPPVL